MTNIIKGSKPASKKHTPTKIEVYKQNPFSDKTLLNGDKVYKRVHGITGNVQDSVVNLDFVVPYNNCKITGLIILAGKFGDKVNFKVYDTPNGDISGTPNLLLNQFGFGVYVNEGMHREMSNYDADLIKDMKLSVEYDAIDEQASRPVYINFILHEVKS